MNPNIPQELVASNAAPGISRKEHEIRSSKETTNRFRGDLRLLLKQFEVHCDQFRVRKQLRKGKEGIVVRETPSLLFDDSHFSSTAHSVDQCVLLSQRLGVLMRMERSISKGWPWTIIHFLFNEALRNKILG
jgi:hypothetical protein